MFKLKESENQSAPVESKPVSSVYAAIIGFVSTYVEKMQRAYMRLTQHSPFFKRCHMMIQWMTQHIAILMVAVIMIAALLALHRPVNEPQLKRVLEIAEQTQYVSSQRLAQGVLLRPVEDIRKKHLLKLNAAIQYEAKRIQHYAPVQTSPKKAAFEYPEYP